MNAKVFLLFTISLGVTGVASASEVQPLFNATPTPKAQTQWNTDPQYWERILLEPNELLDMKLGKSDYVISGPMVDGLRRRRSSPDLNLGERILRLPILRLLVPDPIPSPLGGRRYFLWGESSRPWTAVAGAAATEGLPNPVTHEALSLLSISR
jgi:hypothetical protein